VVGRQDPPERLSPEPVLPMGSHGRASQDGRRLGLTCVAHRAVLVVVDDLVVVASEQARRLAGTAPTGVSPLLVRGTRTLTRLEPEPAAA